MRREDESADEGGLAPDVLDAAERRLEGMAVGREEAASEVYMPSGGEEPARSLPSGARVRLRERELARWLPLRCELESTTGSEGSTRLDVRL